MSAAEKAASPVLWDEKRYHWVWPDGDIAGVCADPDCKREHFLTGRENTDSPVSP